MEQVLTEEVSGRAVFCILGTLAVAAVAQPSARSRITERALLYGNIDLMRCFPGVCLFDALVDLVILGKATRREPSVPKPAHQTRQRVRPKAGMLTVRLALSLLVVLPPTIKVFSMTGVPATQFCAFVFFLANVTNLVLELCDLEIDDHYPSEGMGFNDCVVLLFALTAMVHMVIEFWIWSKIGLSISFHMPEGVEDIFTMVRSICALLICMQVIIWITRYTIAMVRYVMYRRFDMSTSPNMIPIRAVWGLTIVLVTLKGPPVPQTESRSGIAPKSDWMDDFNFKTGLCICTMLVSNILAKILDALGILVSRDDHRSCTHTHVPYHTEKQSGDTEEVPSSSGLGSSLKIFACWISTLGTRIDNYVVQVFDIHTKAGFTISLGIFNLITTVCYYLVWFDGTGTANTPWMTILGYHF